MGLIDFRTRCFTLSLSLLAVVMVASAAAAEPATGRQEKLAASLLDKLHTREVAEAWRKMIVASLPQCGCSDASQTRTKAAWHSAIDAAYDVDKFYGDLQVVFVKSFTAGELEQMLAFRNSALGRKLGILERPNAESEPDAAAAMAKIGAAGRALERNPARRKLMEDLVNASGGIDAMVDMLSSVSLGTSLGAAATIPAGQPRVTQGEIADMIASARPMLRQAVGPMVVPAAAMIYQKLTIRELQQYRAFLMSPLGSKLRDAMLIALNDAMQVQAFAIGARFAREMNAQEM